MNRLFTLAIIPLLAGCTFTRDHKAQIAATGQYLATRAASVAASVVIRAAVDQRDAFRKADFLDSAALGLRTSMLDIASRKQDAREVLRIWTADKPHWSELAERLSTEIELAGGGPDSIESVATGLNNAAASERQL